MGFPMEWTKHLKTPEEKVSFEKSLRNDSVLGLRLYAMIEDWARGIDTKEMNIEEYDNASWAYKQAHLNGLRQAFHIVTKHLEFLKGN